MTGKFLYNVVFVALLLSSLTFCTTKNENLSDVQKENKENVEEQNKEKFAGAGEKNDAQFVVDAIDHSYAILELAELGGQQSGNMKIKEQAQRITEAQTSIINKLKTYAQDNNISVQIAGPEKTRLGVQDLYKEDTDQFDRKWFDEVLKHNSNMITAFEQFEKQADSTLRPVVQSAMETLRYQQDQLKKFQGENI